MKLQNLLEGAILRPKIENGRIVSKHTSKEISQMFVWDKHLTTLEGFPSRVSVLSINNNNLTDLKHCPESQEVHCSYNNLTSLEGLSKSCFNLTCYNNKDLKSLEGVNDNIVSITCHNCGLTSLKFAPKNIAFLHALKNKNLKTFDCSIDNGDAVIVLSETGFTSLEGIHKHILACAQLDIREVPITSSILGLLLIRGLKVVDSGGVHPYQSSDAKKAFSIVRKYIPNTRGRQAVIDCQRELIEAGLQAFAKL
jgi:hypothetical protein